MNKRNKNYIVFTAVCFLLGVLAVRQFYASKLVAKVTGAQEGNMIASEVSGLIEANRKLEKQVAELAEQNDKLSQKTAGSREAREALEQSLKTLEIINGDKDIRGPGIEIQINEELESFFLVDLINALRNIGAEAVSINDQRILLNTYIDNSVFSTPYSIKAIGDKELIYNSLIRPGGIIEQIGQGEVIQRDVLYIPKVE